WRSVAELDGFVAAAHHDLDRAHLPGVVALVGTGVAQLHAAGVGDAELVEDHPVDAAQGPLQLDAVIAEALVDLHRPIHATAAPRLHLAAQGRQRDAADLADVAVAIIEQVEVLELLRQRHGGALL